ncbi:MAG: glycosyltransferase family 39 protein [Candidatus Aureabacteria bacterium]|nr:glycosyltransferase family 39 protein [Candidatus Auribacterota bacterium]
MTLFTLRPLLSLKKWIDSIKPVHVWIGFIVGSAILFLRQYLYCRSLWVDEANLANNIVSRSFSGLLNPLDCNQAAPIGFLFLSKLFTLIFGTSEYTLRLSPLLAAFFSVFLFYIMTQSFLTPWMRIVAVSLIAVNSQLIRYANEFKQYSFDVLATVIIYILADLHLRDRIRTWQFALSGAILIWFSHPSVFVLTGIGTCLMISSLMKKEWGRFNKLCIGIGSWLVSLTLLYMLSLKGIRDTPYFQNPGLWKNGFIPFPWHSLNDLAWINNTFMMLLKMCIKELKEPSFYGRLIHIVMTGAFFAGCIGLLITDRPKLCLLLSPLLVALLASVLRLYPFFYRLILFLLPVTLIIMVSGLHFLIMKYKMIPLVIKIAVWILVIYLPFKEQWAAFRAPSECEEIRPVMEKIHDQWQKEDLIYVYYASESSFEYYLPRFRFPSRNIIQGTRSRENPDHYIREIEKLKGHPRVWLIFSHDYRGKQGSERKLIIKTMKEWGTPLDEFKVIGACYYLFDLT